MDPSLNMDMNANYSPLSAHDSDQIESDSSDTSSLSSPRMEDVAIVSAGSASEAKDYPTWMSVDHAAHFQAIKDAFPTEAEELCNRKEPLPKRDLLAIYDRAVIKLGEGKSSECNTSRERSPQSETGESDLELHANEDFPSEDGRETEAPSKAKRSKMEDSLTGN